MYENFIEGTGEEIARYTKQRPSGHFRLIMLDELAAENKPAARGGPDIQILKEVMEYRSYLRGKMGPLPLEATSTESLYD